MDLDLAGRSVLVTGASRGIGRGIAEAFAAEGARLTVVARTAEDIEEAAASIRHAHGVEVLAVAADVTDPTTATTIIAHATEAYGALDVLVNNAGGNVREGSTDERFNGSFELNVTSAVRLMEAAKPHLVASGGGAVVNIASIYGREFGPPAAAQYTATKAAEIAMSKTFAMQWAREGVRVNSIAPGSIAFEGGSWALRTDADPEGMAKFVDEEIASGRFGRVEEVAAAVVFLASARASWVVGVCLNVDGGQSRSGI